MISQICYHKNESDSKMSIKQSVTGSSYKMLLAKAKSTNRIRSRMKQFRIFVTKHHIMCRMF